MIKEEYTIKLKGETKPFALTVPRKVPMPLYEETKNEITRVIQKAFEEIKSILTAAPVLALYDPSKGIKISADVSSFGLGGVLLQKQEDQTWRPVMFISRALTPVECRYAQIEKEALALTWACEQFSDYIVGKSIIAETDHKPLVPLLTTRTLDEVPPRVQQLRMHLMRFHFKEVNHVPGKEMYIADALSRMQAENSNRMATVPEEEMNILC